MHDDDGRRRDGDEDGEMVSDGSVDEALDADMDDEDDAPETMIDEQEDRDFG